MPLLDWIADLFWPPRCLACAGPDGWLCHACLTALPPPPTPREHRGVRVIAAGTSDDRTLARGVWFLKYRNMPHLARPLAAQVARAAAYAGLLAVRGPLLVPVPLHPSRERARGYNQAALLAGHLGSITGLPVTDALARTRDTASQVESSGRTARLRNMAGAFGVARPGVAGRQVILVDDVCTTGATLASCAQALREAGAQVLAAFVVTRG